MTDHGRELALVFIGTSATLTGLFFVAYHTNARTGRLGDVVPFALLFSPFVVGGFSVIDLGMGTILAEVIILTTIFGAWWAYRSDLPLLTRRGERMARVLAFLLVLSGLGYVAANLPLDWFRYRNRLDRDLLTYMLASQVYGGLAAYLMFLFRR